MKKILMLFAISVLAGCASSPVEDINDKPSSSSETKNTPTTKVADAPTPVKEESKKAAADEPEPEPPRPQVPPQPSQYAALNEAIKAQSDDKIYQAATQILAQSASDARALNALAMYHYKRSRFELCRYLLTKALAASPKTGELYSNLGIVQLAQDEKRDAIKSFRKALEINSNDGVAAANLGSIYVQEKDFTKANLVLETAYHRGVRDVRVLNNYAVALVANNKYDKAVDLYKDVLKESSGNKEVLYNYAVLLVDHLGKFEEGLEIINRLKFVGGPADTRNRIIVLENKAKAGLK
ncbi:MAG: tetratricopeptide repeat protein [Bdellovibrio sp.]